MFSTLLERMSSTPRAAIHTDMTRASSADSALSAITVDNTSNAQSSSSTPPTSIGDGISISSNSLKLENTVAAPPDQTPVRSRRVRTSVSTYNVKVLSGTAIHAPKKFSKNKTDLDARRRTISGDTLVGPLSSANSSTESVEKDVNRLVRDGIEALDLQWSVKSLPKSKSQIGLNGSPKKSAKKIDPERRISTRSSGEKVESVTSSLTQKLSILGKRGRKTFEDGLAGLTKATRELKNLQDTPEYAHIDTKPVYLETWSNGKLVVGEPPKKRKKVDEPVTSKNNEAEAQATTKSKEIEANPETKGKQSNKKQKVWLTFGLYAGQESQAPSSYKVADSSSAVRTSLEEIAPSSTNPFLPLPMFGGQKLLQAGRNFRLPFDVCSPLPPGQPKPDEWRKTSSNRFVGEAAAMWRKSSLFDSFSSKCVCTPEGGCDEDCQNRIMLYECDDTNCAAGRGHCTNRAFADLQERRKAGGKYRIGVEVIKTADRGYGVRTNRCFKANQIIVEYTGEIITEDECDRRMNEDYKDNECYYLMSFDQSMIIDATKGSIARFVNHSCKPNCRMVKWIVGGKPRMALFAGDNPIMTGDELTYDYNFDPFSAKNVQECRCGSDNCRGVLGPKPKDQKLKETIKDAVKAGVKAGKRKLKDLLGVDDTDHADRSPKKRKIKELKKVKRSASAASKEIAKSAANSVKKSVSLQLFSVRKSVGPKRGSIIVKKTTKASSLKTYGKKQTKISSRKSSMTIVADDGSAGGKIGAVSSIGQRSVNKKKIVRSMRGGRRVRGASGGTIQVISGNEGE